MTIQDNDTIHAAVRERYAAAATSASCCGPTSCGPVDAAIDAIDPFGQSQYGDAERALLPEEALIASLGCGNPTILAELKPGDVVLDLGSGGGIDVLLSARRVAPGGKAYGLDMTPEMLDLANANKARAGIENVEFLLGSIEDVPLPDASVDVIISNCVVNLSPDKQRVFAESFRVLTPDGRFAISDMVLSRPLPSELASVMALWTGCIAGALTEEEVVSGLQAAGFTDVTVEPTTVFGRDELEGLAAGLAPEDIPAGVDLHEAIEGLDGVIRAAFIRATKPGTPAPKETHMHVVRVYEPALCCNTGVCGEDVDQALVTFTADLTALAEQGADISRHNLANDPMAFANDQNVRAFLEVAGSEGLPLTTVDGVTVLTGTYPTREQLARFAGIDATPIAPVGVTLLQVADEDTGSSCGCGPSGCC
jgi:SAM-dependent methyltransferase